MNLSIKIYVHCKMKLEYFENIFSQLSYIVISGDCITSIKLDTVTIPLLLKVTTFDELKYLKRKEKNVDLQ